MVVIVADDLKFYLLIVIAQKHRIRSFGPINVIFVIQVHKILFYFFCFKVSFWLVALLMKCHFLTYTNICACVY